MVAARFPRGKARVAAGIALLLTLLVVDGVYAGLAFKSSFQNAACDLKRAARGLSRFEIDSADRRLERALDEVAEAQSFLDHPALKIAGAIPFLDADLEVLDSLTEVAAEAARSGRVGTAMASELGFGGGNSLAGLYSDGRVDLDALEGVPGRLEQARDHLESARSILESAPRARLSRIRRAGSAAARLVTDALASLDETGEVMNDLPSLLGRDEDRTYLLAFQAPSEARGGGGLIGVYGLLSVDAGGLDLVKVAPIRELVPKLKGKVPGPGWFEELYGGLDGLGGWREANSSPTFPVTSRILLKMYERSTGRALDGVMAMDPVVVAELLSSTGPIEARGYPTKIDASNAGQILMRDIYLDFAGREDEQNEFLRDLVDQIWKRLGSGEVDAPALSDAIASSIAGGRLKFYSAHVDERDAIQIAGIDGDPRTAGPNPQMIFHNNFAANKIDWYLRRSQSTSISVQPDGTARFVTQMRLANRAPRGQRSLLKKSDVNELPSGMNLMSLHFMLPEGAVVESVYSGTTPVEFFEGAEAGRFPTVWMPLQLAVGARARVSVSYEVPGFVEFADGRGRLAMTLLPQGLVRPDAFDVSVAVPDGYKIGPDGGQRFTRSGELSVVRKVSARISAPGVKHATGKSDPLKDLCG